MKRNWWGYPESADIEDTFFDGRIEPDLGKVLFEPYLTEKPAIRTQDAGR